MKRSLILALALLTLGLRSPCQAGELRLTIHDIRSASGTMLIGLYDSAASFKRALDNSDKDGFSNDPDRVAGMALRASGNLRSDAIFCNLTPGRYAIIVFQDENGNGKLDKNALGVPLEPYGFSNDAQGFLGPPSFDDAAMLLGNGDHSVDVTLVYHAAHAPHEDIEETLRGASTAPISSTGTH